MGRVRLLNFLMDQSDLRNLERRCTQEDAPPCQAACPLHVDARALCRLIAAGNWSGAWKVLRRNMPLAPILARICDAPCQAACHRDRAGGAIRIGALERACAGTPAPPLAKSFRPPARDAAVAICGSGLSGLTAAADLAAKGWTVELFEPQPVLGAPLKTIDPRRLPQAVMETETAALAAQLAAVHLAADPGSQAAAVDLRRRFDAVYLDLAAVATGPWNLPAVDPAAPAMRGEGLFAGGDALSPVMQAAQGRWAATAIDRYLQHVSLTAGREGEGPRSTRLFVNLKGIAPLVPAAPADAAAGLSPAEAVAEAGRCLQCECLECVKVCAYLAHYGAYPRQYARQIYNNAAIVMGARQANRMINSCSLCGLCQEICPEDFSMADLCLQARQDMVARGKMPPTAHEFALRDLHFSRSDRFCLARHAPGSDRSAHLFFPGCQLCASSPEQVEAVYRHLRRTMGAPVGLMLGCCGAPAHWAGRQSLYDEVKNDWRRQWESMGRPELVLACATCLAMFGEHLPEVPSRSLWEVMAEGSLPAFNPMTVKGPLAVHDPCTTRRAPSVQAAVRRILERLDVPVAELDLGRARTECCGFGGLMQNANPQLADETVRRRAGRSPHDYLAYCAMCRDNLCATGKRAIHLLDLFFAPATAGDAALRPRPGWSQRRDNRERLRRELLADIWHERDPRMEAHRAIQVHMSPEIRRRIEERRILTEDLQQVIHQAEAAHLGLVHPDTGRIRAALKSGHVTFWVEYAPAGDGGYEIFNAYSHRMEVVGP